MDRFEISEAQWATLEREGSLVLGTAFTMRDDDMITSSDDIAPQTTDTESPVAPDSLAARAARAANRIPDVTAVADEHLSGSFPEPPPRPCTIRRKLPRARRIRPGLRRRHRASPPTRGSPGDDDPDLANLHPTLRALIEAPEATWQAFSNALAAWERARREADGDV